jgi:hypothetical protein
MDWSVMGGEAGHSESKVTVCGRPGRRLLISSKTTRAEECLKPIFVLGVVGR